MLPCEEDKTVIQGNDLIMHKTMIFLIILLAGAALFGPRTAQGSGTQEIRLLDNCYNVEASGNTGSPECIFFVPHFNEKIGTEASEEIVRGWNKAAVYVLRPCNADVENAMKRDHIPFNDPAERYLYFSFNSQWYSIDPNRIYTGRGVEREILLFRDGRWERKAALDSSVTVPAQVNQAVQKAGEAILAAAGIAKPSPPAVVAVHNNSPTRPRDLETFSFLWYKEKGPCHHEVEKKDGIPCIYEGDPSHWDNLILVNRYEDFQYLRKDGRFNIVLMHTPAPGKEGDDGSLSVYCGQRGIRYVNVEARHMGTTSLMDKESREYQYRMLKLIRKMIETR
ncbi:MAG: hypothetical protein AB2L14_27605 [Candidatus Xenobiia bacterium LiM19]